eukprot:TRINITY_DN15740_c0_g1_i1.p1 TRINITY_DN15740_c0_g1~~TRINITY_DN15740_c0_g1_i1.p1  ORF type:complete len:239 (+),score=72.35 TRINITY_DN15740_c0_g1_i1:75-791(+)
MPFLSTYQIGGQTITLEQRPEAAGPGDKRLNANSGTVWDAALVLAHFLARRGRLDGTVCCELGSGTGIVAAAAAALGAEVVATDFPEVCELTARNAELNASITGGRLRVEPLDWDMSDEATMREKGLGSVDVVLGSDLVCGDLYSRRALCDVLRRLLAPGSSSKRGAPPFCLLAHERRDGDRFDAFLQQLRESGLTAARIPSSELDPDYCSPDIAVLCIASAAPAAAERAPADDEDLY